jgi:hypothetical protein
MFTPFAFVKSTAAAAPAATLLLDVYPGAAFAHSFRKLRTAYTGNCIQIRKESDNSTLNIGFDSNGYVDTAAITAFVGAGSAQISIWYDQSGNSIDFTPTGDAGSGFRIVIGGTIQTVNSKVAAYSPNGYGYSMGSSAYSYNGTEYQITTVSQTNALSAPTNNYGRIFSYKNSGDTDDYNTCNGFIGFYGYSLSGRVATGQNNVFANSAATAFSANTQYIGWNYKEQNTIGVSLNGGTDATAATGCSSTGMNINRVRYASDYKNSDSSFIGYIQEMVTWETYTSGDKSGILSNINTFYATY